MTGQLSALAQGKAAGAPAGYTSKLLKTGQTTQVGTFLDDGYYEVGVAKSYTVNSTGSQSGTTGLTMPVHTTNRYNALTFTASTQTIANMNTGIQFKADGGEQIVITGSANNNGLYTTVSYSGTNLVVASGLTDEAASARWIYFYKYDVVSNNTVTDNNTGLTWLRYHSTKAGKSLADGSLTADTNANCTWNWCIAANNASLGGYSDWRVPNIFELMSIVNNEYGAIGLDATAFPSITATYLWSSTSSNSTSANYYYAVWLKASLAVTESVVLKRINTAADTYLLLVRG
jgi:hypothetical protein